jgi:PAS domain S-box-containing protein
MGISPVSPTAGAASGRPPPPGIPAGVVEYAVSQLLRGDDDAADVLPAVLGQLAAAAGSRAVLALQQDATGSLVILAAQPPEAASDAALITELGELGAAHPGAARAGGSFSAPLNWGRPSAGARLSLLMAYAAPTDDQCLCAIALVGDPAGWTADTHAVARVIAGIVAAQIQHANDRAQLVERQALTSALIEGSPDAIVVAGPDARIVSFNPAAEALYERKQGDVIGQSAVELLIPERNRAAYVEGMQSYLESGDRGPFVGRMRYPALRPDGSERMTELTPIPIMVDRVVHFCGFMRDISELELAHEALMASEARFRVLAELAPVGIVEMNADAVCTFANERWCDLAEMTAADAIGAGWLSALHPDDAQRVEQEWALAAARGTELRTDCRMVSASGREIWVHAVVLPLLSATGQQAGFLTAVTDVSARKRAEAEREQLLAAERAARRKLADQTERLNSLITNAIPGIVMLDEHLRIARLNQSARALFGIPGEHLVGATVDRLVEEIKPIFADPVEFLRRTAELGDLRRPAEGEQFGCRDGRTIEVDYWPVFVEGEFRGDLWLFWDVSERIAMQAQRDRMLKAEFAARDAAEQAQRRLAEQNAKLQDLDEAKTQFLATMSHELRSPLTSIVSFTELIIDGADRLSAQTLESLRVITRNADRLLRLVGDLLLLSSVEAGVLPLEADTVSICALIDETVRAASASASAQGIGIEVRAQDGPAIQGDQLRLQQVLDNLLSNAVKFSPAGRQVTLAATHDERMWRIAVTDAGIGIPPDDIGQLFSRFVRGSNARAKGLPGTGLGLSIVKAITELHGGRVEVRSAVGSGSTFSVYLPIRP